MYLNCREKKKREEKVSPKKKKNGVALLQDRVLGCFQSKNLSSESPKEDAEGHAYL